MLLDSNYGGPGSNTNSSNEINWMTLGQSLYSPIEGLLQKIRGENSMYSILAPRERSGMYNNTTK